MPGDATARSKPPLTSSVPQTTVTPSASSSRVFSLGAEEAPP